MRGNGLCSTQLGQFSPYRVFPIWRVAATEIALQEFSIPDPISNSRPLRAHQPFPNLSAFQHETKVPTQLPVPVFEQVFSLKADKGRLPMK